MRRPVADDQWVQQATRHQRDRLLQQGRPAADVAFALGYADQPHMIRSIKAIMGQTPGQLAAQQTVGNLQSG